MVITGVCANADRVPVRSSSGAGRRALSTGVTRPMITRPASTARRISRRVRGMNRHQGTSAVAAARRAESPRHRAHSCGHPARSSARWGTHNSSAVTVRSTGAQMSPASAHSCACWDHWSAQASNSAQLSAGAPVTSETRKEMSVTESSRPRETSRRYAASRTLSLGSSAASRSSVTCAGEPVDTQATARAPVGLAATIVTSSGWIGGASADTTPARRDASTSRVVERAAPTVETATHSCSDTSGRAHRPRDQVLVAHHRQRNRPPRGRREPRQQRPSWARRWRRVPRRCHRPRGGRPSRSPATRWARSGRATPPAAWWGRRSGRAAASSAGAPPRRQVRTAGRRRRWVRARRLRRTSTRRRRLWPGLSRAPPRVQVGPLDSGFPAFAGTTGTERGGTTATGRAGMTEGWAGMTGTERGETTATGRAGMTEGWAGMTGTERGGTTATGRAGMTGTGRGGTSGTGPERRERTVDRRGGVCRSNVGSRCQRDGRRFRPASGPGSRSGPLRPWRRSGGALRPACCARRGRRGGAGGAGRWGCRRRARRRGGA